VVHRREEVAAGAMAAVDSLLAAPVQVYGEAGDDRLVAAAVSVNVLRIGLRGNERSQSSRVMRHDVNRHRGRLAVFGPVADGECEAIVPVEIAPRNVHHVGRGAGEAAASGPMHNLKCKRISVCI
jgi:hypothetical protein